MEAPDSLILPSVEVSDLKQYPMRSYITEQTGNGLYAEHFSRLGLDMSKKKSLNQPALPPLKSTDPAFGERHSLRGQLLLASPHIGDPRFEQAVILMCQHDADAAMGLVLNQPAQHLSVGELYSQLKMGTPRFNQNDPVFIGGPVDGNRGFVLHSQDHMRPESVAVTHEIGLTSSIDILRDINDGVGPLQSIVSLGCSGWGPGQLDQELAENAWFPVEANLDLVFSYPPDALWQHGFDKLGINPAYFADSNGSA